MKIRWLLSHEPITLFKRAAAAFAKEVAEKTQGKVEIEVLTLSEYAAKYNDGKETTHYDALPLLQSGAIEMSQTYTTYLGQLNFDMYALDLPFLFRDHDHSGKVLDSEIGEGLMAGLKEKANIKGLAFTYSGGFRIIPATSQIRSVEDFKGMALRVCRSPVAVDVFKALGANPQAMKIEDLAQGVKEGRIEGGESTYPRIYPMGQAEVTSVINKTEHSLFLTTILMAGDFWDGLTPELQKIMKDAAQAAALVERAESIADIALTEEMCRRDGIEIASLPPEEQVKFEAIASVVYGKYVDQFTPGLVKGIKEIH